MSKKEKKKEQEQFLSPIERLNSLLRVLDRLGEVITEVINSPKKRRRKKCHKR